MEPNRQKRQSMTAGIGVLTALCIFGLMDARGLADEPSVEPTLVSLRILPNGATLWGSGAAQRFVVLGTYSDGLERDVTDQTWFVLSDLEKASIDAAGRLTARADGELELTAEVGEVTAKTRITIEGSDVQPPFSFARVIGGILTKRGCNAADCHGGVKGKNGFKLSLNAVHPREDHKWIVEGGEFQVLTDEASGPTTPRINPEQPEQSLILVKATGEAAHGGGRRFEAGSSDYQTILEWVASGAPYGAESGEEPVVIEGIEILPRESVLGSEGRQQLLVTARLSNGRREDMTDQVIYKSNNKEVARVNAEGVVEPVKPGETAIMVRAAGHAASARVGVIAQTVPNYPEIEGYNVIDEHVFAKLRKFNIVPSELCTDAEFVRRVCLDVAGTLPPGHRVREFVEDPDPDKRNKLIDVLLASPEYVDYWTYRFADVFRVSNYGLSGSKYAAMYWQWIRDSVAANKPYDQIAIERIAAQGFDGPSRHFYHVGGELPKPPNEMAEQVRVFLGRRLDCAQCHNHPYEAWSQDQFWGLSAFYGDLTRLGQLGIDMVIIDDPAGHGEIGAGQQVIHPRTKQVVLPTFPDGQSLSAAERVDLRRHFARWVTEHPYFAEALVNRIWSSFFGRGLVDPVDDFRSTNPPSHPELLALLAEEFKNSGYDLKHLMRLIVQSKTYQLSGIPNDTNREDEMNYSWRRPRPLDAEVLFDAICQVTGVYGEFGGAHNQRRAVNLVTPDLHPLRFLKVYGQPDRMAVPERKNEANLDQALHMLAGSTYNEKLGRDGGRLARLLESETSDREIVNAFYMAAYARQPDPDEAGALEAMIAERADRKEALEDMVWAMMTSREFAHNN